MARLDTDLLGLPILSREDASIVGEIDALIIDDDGLRVAGFLVDLGVYEASVLPFAKALAIGADAVIVERAESLTLVSADPELERLALKDITVTDATAITVSGKSVGVLGDFFVDTESGAIAGVEFIPSDISVYPKEPAVIPVSCIERLGREIAVLKDNYHQHLLRDGNSLQRLSRPLEPGEAVNGAPPAPEVRPAEPEPLFVPQEEAAGPTVEPRRLPEEPEEPETLSGEPEPAGPRAAQQAEPAAAEAKPAATAPDLADTETEPKATPEATSPPAEEPKHFLIGKKVLRRIEDSQGGLLADEGDLVDYDMILRAKESDLLLILSLNVE